MSHALGHKIVFSEYFLNLFETGSDLFLGMRGHQREADKRILWCDGGRNHRIDKHTLFEKS